jgi:hypothetical protein
MSGSGRVSRIPFEYNGAQLYERGRKALRGRQSGVDLKYRKAAAAIIFMEKPCGVNPARLSRLGAGLIAGSPRRRLVDRELSPKPVSFDGLGRVPARERIVHCLIPTGERKP